MATRRKKSRYEPLSDEAFSALIAEVKRPKSADEKRFVKLGWKILEAKFNYYVMDAPTLQDHDYDQMEREYDALAKKLGVPPTASDMVGFKGERPSCQLAGDKVLGVDPPDEA